MEPFSCFDELVQTAVDRKALPSIRNRFLSRQPDFANRSGLKTRIRWLAGCDCVKPENQGRQRSCGHDPWPDPVLPIAHRFRPLFRPGNVAGHVGQNCEQAGKYQVADSLSVAKDGHCRHHRFTRGWTEMLKSRRSKTGCSKNKTRRFPAGFRTINCKVD